MSFRKNMADALYFAVGAIATGIEAVADGANALTQKGSEVVTKGKEVFNDFCKKHEIPDDVEPAVTIEEDLGDIAEV